MHCHAHNRWKCLDTVECGTGYKFKAILPLSHTQSYGEQESDRE